MDVAHLFPLDRSATLTRLVLALAMDGLQLSSTFLWNRTRTPDMSARSVVFSVRSRYATHIRHLSLVTDHPHTAVPSLQRCKGLGNGLSFNRAVVETELSEAPYTARRTLTLSAPSWSPSPASGSTVTR
jgi:hypothetical protein